MRLLLSWMQRCIDGNLHLMLATSTGTAEPHTFLTALKMAGSLFLGIADIAMAHDKTWHCGPMG